MRILQVTNTYYPELKFGGPPQKIHTLSRLLAASGHQVSVLTFDSQNRRACDVRQIDGVTVQYLRWRGWGLRQWPADRAVIANAVAKADVVHCYGLYNFLCPSASKIARQKKVHCLLEPLGMYQPRAGNVLFKRIYHRLFTAAMFRDAARVIATSPLEFAELKTAVPEARLVLRRNGIDVERFKNLPEPAVFRAKLGIAPGERMILYLGRISPIKNLEHLVRAFSAAAPERCRLVLAGPENEADYAAQLRALVRSLRLESRVIFSGVLSGADLIGAFAAAEFFVLPSLSESYGNAAAEAVAAGVPVLLTETCGIAPLIHRRAGLAVPLGVESLTNGLRVMMDAEQRRSLVEARAQVVSELSWDEPVAQTERMYQAVIQS